jgi:hypothetical protein
VFIGAKNTRSFMCGALSEKSDAATELAFARTLLAQVAAGLPRDRLALHVCRGNWTRDEHAALAGDYRPLLSFFADAPVGTLFLELATPARRRRRPRHLGRRAGDACEVCLEVQAAVSALVRSRAYANAVLGRLRREYDGWQED